MMTARKQLARPESLPALAARLIELGYFPVPIPSGCKGPTISGWDKLRMAVNDAPRYFSEPGMLVGALHINLACFDIDVLDPDLAAEIVAEGFRRFPGALERIGRAPKSAIVLRLDEPGFKVSNTEKHSRITEDGEVFDAQVEVRTLTRQMVVYGKHPDTGQPYRWPRGELWETPREDLPPLTRDAAQDFRDWCNERIRAWAGADKSGAMLIDLGNYRPSSVQTDEKPSEKSFLEALRHVPANYGYLDGWLPCLMGIHDFYGGSYRGLEVAKDWSASDPRYNPREVEDKWRSFEAGKGVGYKTVLHHAKQNGCDMAALWRLDHPQASAAAHSAAIAAVSVAPDCAASEGEAPQRIDVSKLFKPWVPIDPLAHPRRDFIYGNHYIRKFASITVAPGGLGKSSLVLVECIAIATGLPLLGIRPKQRERVVYFNAEDPAEEIERRVLAICQHFRIDQNELAGWLFTQSGRDLNLIFSAGEDGQIVEPVFDLIEAFSDIHKPAVFAFDPLANMTDAPETNDVFRRLGKRLSMMADKLNCSIELVHHTRKLNGNDATVEDSRGGSALIGAVRAGRALNAMTADEAAKAGLETHIDHFRIEAAGKNNLARSSERAIWHKRVSVELPNGEFVAAVTSWEWPDAFDGVSKEDARRVQMAIEAMTGEPPSASNRSAKWAGYVVARVLGWDAEDKGGLARINTMLKTWVRTGVLAISEMHDSRNGREVKVITAGPTNPMSEENVK